MSDIARRFPKAENQTKLLRAVSEADKELAAGTITKKHFYAFVMEKYISFGGRVILTPEEKDAAQTEAEAK